MLDAATVTTNPAGAIPLVGSTVPATTTAGSSGAGGGGAATTATTTAPSNGTAGVLENISAAGGDVGAVVNQFRAVQGAKSEAVGKHDSVTCTHRRA